jgi:SAM-dependent methyltransferase
VTDPWVNHDFLRGAQYKTDVNLAARQSIYAYQHPRVDLAARVLDLAAPAPSATIVDVGCGNGMYLAELARRGCVGRALGVDLSLGMLTAARQRLHGVPKADAPKSDDQSSPADVGTASAVALANADATALPLRDGVADLALAPHMLYHVPEPAQALRELRRVTRPGGRVVIVLNGAGHLRQLRTALAASRGDDAGAVTERVTLDDGESLTSAVFSNVTRHDFVGELRVPDPAPIADYVRSMAGTSHYADPERVIATVVATLPRSPEGHYLISTHTGCLICEP